MKKVRRAYGFPKVSATTIMMPYKYTKVIVQLPDNKTNLSDTLAGVLQILTLVGDQNQQSVA